jgi:flavodoxin
VIFLADSKILVAYYSRTGTTRLLAQKISYPLRSAVDEIDDKKERKGVMGFLSGGKDAMEKKSTEINSRQNPNDFDLVIIGCPVWVGTIPPAIRAYAEKFPQLKVNCENGKTKVAFFSTAGSDVNNCFTQMKELFGEPIETLLCTTKEARSDSLELKEKIAKFCSNALTTTLGKERVAEMSKASQSKNSFSSKKIIKKISKKQNLKKQKSNKNKKK